MRSQFWKPITPVNGQDIPNQSEYRADTNAKWCDPDLELFPQFDQDDTALQWREPVEACPMSIAVEAIMQNAGFRCGGYVGSGQRSGWNVQLGSSTLFSESEEKLREMVASRLRELADKEFPE